MTSEQEILTELRGMRADIVNLMTEVWALRAIDDAVDAPNRVLIQKLNEEVTRLREHVPKTAAAAAVGGGTGLIALIIEGVRLWIGTGGGGHP